MYKNLHWMIYLVIFMITFWLPLIICKDLKDLTYNYKCCCSNQIGGWSTEGLSVAKSQSDRMSVTCVTTHLTSFAVLVSTQGERPVSYEHNTYHHLHTLYNIIDIYSS